MRTARLALLLLVTALLLCAGTLWFVPRTLFYAGVLVQGSGGLRIDVRAPGDLDRAACELRAARLAAAFMIAGSGLTVTRQCRLSLDSDTALALSAAALPVVSTRTGDGTVLRYQADSAAFTRELCSAAEALTRSRPAGQRATCFAAGAPRPWNLRP